MSLKVMFPFVLSLSPSAAMNWPLFLEVTVFFGAFPLAFCGSVVQGGSCSTNNNRLDSSSRRFLSDCDDETFCTAVANGTCEFRQCRRDEFPFGFQSSETLPPLCSVGQFCPDEGSECKNLAPVGQSCQFSRDDQCMAPNNWADLASNQNFNGSLCLQSTCVYANASLGQRCMMDTTTYVDLGPDFKTFANTITRHNCRTPQFYCDTDHLQCLPTKSMGLSCIADQECRSFSCDPSGTCTNPSEMPIKVASWQYASVIAFVLAAMTATVMMLVVIHKRIRLRHYSELRGYYEEQLSLRRSMFALHAAAADKYEDEKSSVNHD